MSLWDANSKGYGACADAGRTVTAPPIKQTVLGVSLPGALIPNKWLTLFRTRWHPFRKTKGFGFDSLGVRLTAKKKLFP